MVGRRDLLKRGGAAAAAVAFAGGHPNAVSPSEVDGAGRRGDDDPTPRHLVLVLVDRSGSMGVVRDATIEGINKLLDEQRDKPDMLISLIQFDELGSDSKRDLLITETFDFTPAPQTVPLTDADYVPRGGTPLYRAIAFSIAKMEAIARPQDKVLLAIQTDGADTDFGAHEVTLDSVKSLIEAREKAGNWTFAFMAADLSAQQESAAIGVAAANSYGYAGSNVGTTAAWTATSTGTSAWYQSSDKQIQYFYAQPNATSANPSITLKLDKDPTTADNS